MIGVPRRRGELGRHRERLGPRGLRVVVAEIVDHLLDADGVLGRQMPLGHEPPHVGIGRGVDVDREGGERAPGRRLPGVVVDPPVLLGIEVPGVGHPRFVGPDATEGKRHLARGGLSRGWRGRGHLVELQRVQHQAEVRPRGLPRFHLHRPGLGPVADRPGDNRDLPRGDAVDPVLTVLPRRRPKGGPGHAHLGARDGVLLRVLDDARDGAGGAGDPVSRREGEGERDGEQAREGETAWATHTFLRWELG